MQTWACRGSEGGAASPPGRGSVPTSGRRGGVGSHTWNLELSERRAPNTPGACQEPCSPYYVVRTVRACRCPGAAAQEGPGGWTWGQRRPAVAMELCGYHSQARPLPPQQLPRALQSAAWALLLGTAAGALVLPRLGSPVVMPESQLDSRLPHPSLPPSVRGHQALGPTHPESQPHGGHLHSMRLPGGGDPAPSRGLEQWR